MTATVRPSSLRVYSSPPQRNSRYNPNVVTYHYAATVSNEEVLKSVQDEWKVSIHVFTFCWDFSQEGLEERNLYWIHSYI
jgi:hypothetical protein